MLRNVGRIILLAVGGLMLAFAITVIVKDFNQIKELVDTYKTQFKELKDLSGLQALFAMLKNTVTAPESKQLLISLGLQLFTCIAAISAILSAIFNHGGFWFTIFSAILLGLFITDIVAKSKTGAFAKDKFMSSILQLFKDAGLQIGYIVGFLILKLTPKTK